MTAESLRVDAPAGGPSLHCQRDPMSCRPSFCACHCADCTAAYWSGSPLPARTV